MSERFPEAPSRRRGILVLSEHDRAKVLYTPGDATMLADDEIHVLAFPLRPGGSDHPALQRIASGPLARPGTFLVQSPFDADLYEELEAAPQEFALAKHFYFTLLCQLLGARTVTVEQVQCETSTTKRTMEVGGKRGGVGSADAKVESDQLAKLAARLELEHEFEGGPPDVDAAETLLRRTGLAADPTMRGLLEMRSYARNALREQRYVIDLASETRRSLSVAAKVKLTAVGELSAKVKSICEEKQPFRLTVKVRF